MLLVSTGVGIDVNEVQSKMALIKDEHSTVINFREGPNPFSGYRYLLHLSLSGRMVSPIMQAPCQKVECKFDPHNPKQPMKQPAVVPSALARGSQPAASPDEM